MSYQHPPAGVPQPPPPPPLPHHHGHAAPAPPSVPPPGKPYYSSPPSYAPAGATGPGQDPAAAASAHSGDPLLAVPVFVAPRLEPQPWARDVWRWLADNTVGVARVDLFRPTPPSLEQYAGGNLLVIHSQHQQQAGGRQAGRRGRAPAPAAYPADDYAVRVLNQFHQPLDQYGAVAGQVAGNYGSRLTGARIKITRSFLAGRHPTDPDAKPLFDFGLGVALEVDRQKVMPVARIKVKDLVSIKAVPLGVVKFSHCLPLGPVALKVRYEVPLSHANRFWEPPARLMVRLDSRAGSGFHLTPGGIEFDEKVVRFGKNVMLHASAGVTFPRQLPIDWDSEGEDAPFKVKVHRLSLKSIW